VDDEEFGAWLRRETLNLFDLEPWHVGLAPAPLEVRLRSAVARSRRRKLWRQARRLGVRA
jgi:hypothetical protein